MQILDSLREGVFYFSKILVAMLSALLLANLVVGPLELKISLVLVTILLIVFGRFLNIDIIQITFFSGLISIVFDALIHDWQRVLVDLSWLSVAEDFSINKSYLYGFLIALSLLIAGSAALKISRRSQF